MNPSSQKIQIQQLAVNGRELTMQKLGQDIYSRRASHTQLCSQLPINKIYEQRQHSCCHVKQNFHDNMRWSRARAQPLE